MIGLIVSALLSGHALWAREYSANVGVDWTSAHATRGDVTGRANARFGFEMRWSLNDAWTFETGTDYVFRRVRWTRDDGRLVHVDFDYVDVPATFRAHLGGRLSLIAGPRIAINVSDKPEIKAPAPSFDPGAHAVIVLGEVGVRVDLSPRAALDVTFEREFGDFARDLREYQAASVRGVYLF